MQQYRINTLISYSIIVKIENRHPLQKCIETEIGINHQIGSNTHNQKNKHWFKIAPAYAYQGFIATARGQGHANTKQ